MCLCVVCIAGGGGWGAGMDNGRALFPLFMNDPVHGIKKKQFISDILAVINYRS